MAQSWAWVGDVPTLEVPGPTLPEKKLKGQTLSLPLLLARVLMGFPLRFCLVLYTVKSH